MRPNVERQFGPWDEAFQREAFTSSTDPTSHEIVELDREPVGCQWVRSHPGAPNKAMRSDDESLASSLR